MHVVVANVPIELYTENTSAWMHSIVQIGSCHWNASHHV
jgi:hypothetical protein